MPETYILMESLYRELIRFSYSSKPREARASLSPIDPSQAFLNAASAASMKKGLYHALVRADNTEPVSGLPMSSLYYDVDLDVVRDVSK